ncbi:MAG: 16S rRNA (guanine(527)-N(7))-methyltransferase RsmG [Candidatus Atribacteria bacterium]|nr:16S rRNA (guanine(527)-N(7))-methyltransferase RsmG [Candidatus Atribacteria bacterium]
MDNLWKRERTLLEEGIQKLGISMGRENVEKMENFVALLFEWNRRLNLTGCEEKTTIVTELILDSLSALNYVEGATLIDVGTGGGIPGIPLKIALPDLTLTLVESQKKKVSFLEEAVHKLSLSKVHIQNERAESAAHHAFLREQFDTVTAKALASLAITLELTAPFLKTGGLGIYYKGRRYREEVKEAQRALDLLFCVIEDIKEVPIPFTERKTYLILVRKRKSTPLSFPRKAGLPQKKPLL